MPEGSICNCCSQPAVAGFVATIQVKLNGVRNSASTLATAERLTDKAVLPPPKCVMTFDNEPPGQAATRIMAASTLGGSDSASVANQVANGNSTNWGTSPTTTARGAATTRWKSAARNSNATEKTIKASTNPNSACWPDTAQASKVPLGK